MIIPMAFSHEYHKACFWLVDATQIPNWMHKVVCFIYKCYSEIYKEEQIERDLNEMRQQLDQDFKFEINCLYGPVGGNGLIVPILSAFPVTLP